jgi:hypothetical protein
MTFDRCALVLAALCWATTPLLAAGPPATPAPAAAPPAPTAAPAVVEVATITTADIAGAGATDSMSVPLPGELLAALGKQCKPNWAAEFRPPINTALTNRAQIALNLGALIADGYVAVEAQDSQQVKNIGRDILALGKALGISNEVIARGSSIAQFAENNEWNALKEELEATQNEVKNAMEKIRDDDLVTLISLGGWVRGTEIVADIIYNNYSDATASLIRQPALAAFLRGKINNLSPKVREDPLVVSLNKQLEEVQKLVTFPLGTTATKEDVKKLKDAVAAMVKEIATKTN